MPNFSIYLDDDTYWQLKQYAKDNPRDSISGFVRIAIQDAFETIEAENRAERAQRSKMPADFKFEHRQPSPKTDTVPDDLKALGYTTYPRADRPD